MRVVAFMNQKGGVGKTTTVVNLGAALAREGQRVLIIDCDAQANASTHLGVDIYAGHPSLYAVLTQGARLIDVRVRPSPGLYLVPAELDLAGADMELASAIGRETLLRDALRRHQDELSDAGEPPYDLIFLDCPPSLGLLPLNALAAANEVAIVIQAEFFALQGIGGLQRFVELVVDRINPTLTTSMVIVCMYDARTRYAREVIDDIGKHFGPQMLQTLVRRTVKLTEAPSHGVSIFDYDASSSGAADYAQLARELLARQPGGRRAESPKKRATGHDKPSTAKPGSGKAGVSGRSIAPKGRSSSKVNPDADPEPAPESPAPTSSDASAASSSAAPPRPAPQRPTPDADAPASARAAPADDLGICLMSENELRGLPAPSEA